MLRDETADLVWWNAELGANGSKPVLSDHIRNLIGCNGTARATHPRIEKVAQSIALEFRDQPFKTAGFRTVHEINYMAEDRMRLPNWIAGSLSANHLLDAI